MIKTLAHRSRSGQIDDVFLERCIADELILMPLIDRTGVPIVRLRPVAVVTVQNKKFGLSAAGGLLKEYGFDFDREVVRNDS